MAYGYVDPYGMARLSAHNSDDTYGTKILLYLLQEELELELYGKLGGWE